MKNWWKYIGVLAIGSAAFYYLTILFMPNIIYAGAKKKIKSRPGYAINKLSVSPIVEAFSRAVVMPNPDFIYLTSFYDLSDGPLRLSGDMPDSTYWSVAMYHPNTVNWYVKNDQQYKEERLQPNLLGQGKTEKKYRNLDLDIKIKNANPLASQISDGFIHCYKKKGFLLVRVLITDRTEEKVREYQEILEKVRLERM